MHLPLNLPLKAIAICSELPLRRTVNGAIRGRAIGIKSFKHAFRECHGKLLSRS